MLAHIRTLQRDNIFLPGGYSQTVKLVNIKVIVSKLLKLYSSVEFNGLLCLIFAWIRNIRIFSLHVIANKVQIDIIYYFLG